MMKRIHKIALLLVASSLSGHTLAWSEESAKVWIARNQALIEAANQPVVSVPEGQTAPAELILYATQKRGFSWGSSAEETSQEKDAIRFINGFGAACDGLTMEHIKNGGRNMPTWAQTAQGSFCLSIKDLTHAYKDKPSDDDRCASLKRVIKNAKKAEKGDDPDAVVESAAALIAAAERLRSIKIELIQKSVIGDGHRTFSCD